MIDKEKYLKMQQLIDGCLSNNSAETLKSEIQSSPELFNEYIELKEANFLKDKGSKASKKLQNNVLNMVCDNKVHHFKYILRLLKDEIVVISGDQENLGFRGIKANFAYRVDNKTESVVINRQIDGYKLSLIVTPVETKKEFSLAVVFENNDSFDVTLINNSKEIERIENTSVQKIFKSYISSDSDVDLIFKKENVIQFTINIQLKSE